MTRPVLKARRGLLVSRIAVIVLALASSYFYLFSITFMWGAPMGGIGIAIDAATGVVTYIEPQSVAKGIHLGDRVDLSAMPFTARGYLYQMMLRPSGIHVTVPFIHDGRHRTMTVETYKTVATDYTSDQNAFFWSRRIVAMLFVATAVILVWNRPSVMLWGLAVFLIRTHDYVIGPFTSPARSALEILAYAVVFALGLPGLMVFAARFPDGRANRTTKYWDALAAATFICSLYASVHDFIPLFTAQPIGDLPGDTLTTAVTSAIYLFIFAVLCAKLRRPNCSRSTGLGWIVAGYGVGIVVGRVGLNDLFDVIDYDTAWPLIGQLVLMLAMPASVAYSVIGHRAFGLGYVANRTLVYSAVTIVVAFASVIAIWEASFYLHSTLGLGTVMFVAALLGMAFQTSRGYVTRLVDRIFLPHRYEAGLSLDRMRETLRGTNDAKRVTGEVASALRLTSVAVFERASDGGFVRNAAYGWPYGAAWHLLPEEALTRSLCSGAPVITLPDDVAEDSGFAAAHARPRIALTIRRGGRVERAVLVGPCSDGASLDRDAIRSLHGVFDEALVL